MKSDIISKRLFKLPRNYRQKVKEVCVHSLRHTYSTHLLEQGANIVTIKELLGHSVIKTT